MADSNLLDPRLKEQFNLGVESLEPTFLEGRGAISSALENRGLGRSSTAINAMQQQTVNEQSAVSDLFRDVLGKQLGLEEAEIGRKFTAEQNALNRASNEYIAETTGQMNIDAMQGSARAGASGNIASAGIDLLSNLFNSK